MNISQNLSVSDVWSVLILVIFCIVLFFCAYLFWSHNRTYATISMPGREEKVEEKEDL